MKGPRGGFYLSVEDNMHTLMDIINVIDGDNKFNTCVLSVEKCDSIKPCPLHNLVSSSKTKFTQSLNKKTIKDFPKHIEEGIAFLPL